MQAAKLLVRASHLAYRLIRHAEQAAIEAARAPLYLFGGYDEDGEPFRSRTFSPLTIWRVRPCRPKPIP